MNVKVQDVMIPSVITTLAHKSVGHARDLMKKHSIQSLPVVNGEGEPEGVVTSSDVLAAKSEGTKLSQIMSRQVHTVPRYSDVHIAARIMRKHHIHHVIVTDGGKIVGIVSTFDLLQLIENRRFKSKEPPTEKRNTRDY